MKNLPRIVIIRTCTLIKCIFYYFYFVFTTNICHLNLTRFICCYIKIWSNCCKVRGCWVISMSKIIIFITSDYYISLVCQFLCLFKIYFLYSCCFVFTCFFKNIAPIVTNFIIIKKRIFKFFILKNSLNLSSHNFNNLVIVIL